MTRCLSLSFLLVFFLSIECCLAQYGSGVAFAPSLTEEVEGYYIDSNDVKQKVILKIPHTLFGVPYYAALRDRVKLVDKDRITILYPKNISEFGFKYNNENYTFITVSKKLAKCRTWILFVPLKRKEKLFAYKSDSKPQLKYKQNLPFFTWVYIGGYDGGGIGNMYITRKVKL